MVFIMALLEQWRKTAYSETADKQKLQQMWMAYFEEEKNIFRFESDSHLIVISK